jgi:hypothetical protein
MPALRDLWRQLDQPFILVRDRHGHHYLVDSDVDAGLFRAWSGVVYTMLDASREVEHVPCTLAQLPAYLGLPEILQRELRARIRASHNREP